MGCPIAKRRMADSHLYLEAVRRAWLFCGGNFLKSPVLQHRFAVGWRATPGLVHFGEVFGVATREHHLSETVAIGAAEPALFDDALVSVVGEHFGPEICVIAGAVTALPDVAEVGGSITRRHVADVEAGPI